MKPFIESPQCDEIYAYLKKRSSEGRTILPSWEDTFRAFRETPYPDLKCIWFLADPYPGIKDGKMVADGIAMSCRNTGKEQPSLSLFYDGITENLGEKGGRNPDLSHLCRQGIMMLNTSLTVELNKVGSHSGVQIKDKRIRLWEPMMKFILEDIITACNQGLILVFAGKESQYYKKYLYPMQHYLLDVEHPAAAAHAERAWKHQNIFSTINKILMQNNNIKVDWLDK